MRFTRTLIISLAAIVIVVAGTLAANAGSTLKVSWVGSGTGCDDLLTLDEAVQLGRTGTLGRPLTTAEKNQISGATFVLAPPAPCGLWLAVDNLGSGFADDIIFDSGLTAPISTSVVLGKNDDIDGTTGNSKVILDGAGRPAGTPGISIEVLSGSQIRNMEIRNFPGSGIFGQATDGAIFEGLNIHNNGAYGISLGFAGGSTNKNCRNTRIGGDQPQHRNNIYSNGADGIFIGASTSTDRFPDQGINILNNRIGTSDGVTDNGNSGRGITLSNAFGVTIGDATGATRNIISGNNNDGVTLDGPGAISNIVIGNLIGTTESGGAALGNGASGIALLNSAGSTADFISTGPNKIGMPGLGNIVSSNNYGIFVADPNTSLNRIQSNLIGTNIGGNADLGNAADGIVFVNGTFENQVGGTGSGEGNLIAFNATGINAASGVRNFFKRNRIFSNDNLGIDLAPAGVTPNDNGDFDSGPNNLQNYPVITYANAQSSTLTLNGTINSAANQTFTIEFFGNTGVDATGFGEGRNYLGSTQITTNAAGNGNFFGLNLSTNLSSVGQWVTATATDPNGNTSEFSQAINICASMALSPNSVLAPVGGGGGNFTVVYSSGCSSYTAAGSASWITVNSVVAGTVTYTVAANNGPPRDGFVNVTYNTGTGTAVAQFLISQNNGCTYSLSRTSANYTAAGLVGDTVTVTSVAGCNWGASSNNSWITLTSGSSGSGNGTVTFTVAPNTGAARTGTMNITGQTFTVNQAAPTAVPRRTLFDYDGDGKADASVYRPSNNAWYLLRSQAGFAAYQFGANGDSLVPMDYTGDGKTDVAIWRPSNAIWYILRSEDNTVTGGGFGQNGDIVAPGDYDGDGKADLAVYRPGASSTFFVLQSRDGFRAFSFGIAEDKPTLGDFDGDGKTDFAVYRPSQRAWYRYNSGNGAFYAAQFGAVGDKIVPADYTGDGKTDLAIWRESTGVWYVLRSEDGAVTGGGFGQAGDIPAPADYDGDGKTDFAVYRQGASSTFYVLGTQTGFQAISWGINGDKPTPNVYVY